VAKQGAPARGDRAGRGQSSDQYAEARFSLKLARLVDFGPRVAEIGRDYLLRRVIEELLRRYLDRLTPEMLRVTGGDRFPSAPIHLVAGGRRR
jgi:hypothetical protein